MLYIWDVDNPLCGPTEASYVFGPQKGTYLVITGEGMIDYQTAFEKTPVLSLPAVQL